MCHVCMVYVTMSMCVCGFICWNLCWCPLACQNTAYLALVQPLLEYGAAMWDPSPKKDTDLKGHTQHTSSWVTTGPWPQATLPISSRKQWHYNPQNSAANYYTSPSSSSIGWLRGWLCVVVLALPPDKFLSQQKPGRLIWAWQQPGYVTTNTTGDYTRNNDRACVIPITTLPPWPETLHYRDCQLAASLNRVAVRAGYNQTDKQNFRSVPCSDRL